MINAGYKPLEMENEKASNAYLMSFIALLAGMPLPIINLLATLLFYLGNKSSTLYVRWHCTQALLSQLTILVVNSIGFTWSMRIVFSDVYVTNEYIAYLIVLLLANLTELSLNLYAAIKVRKGEHVRLDMWADMADLIVKM